MTFAEKMKGLAKEAAKKLVLAEGLEPRTVRAARKIVDEGLASSVTLVGNEEKVREWLKKGVVVSPTVKQLLNSQGIAISRKD